MASHPFSIKVAIECEIGPKFKLLESAIKSVSKILETQPENEPAKDALRDLGELLETVKATCSGYSQ